MVATAAAVGISLLQTKEYSASASLLFRDPQFAEQLLGTPVAGQTDPTREAATNLKLVELKTVGYRTAKVLDHGLTGAQVSQKVSVAAQGQSNLVSVNATDRSPKRAQLLANTFARQFIKFRADADRSKLAQARRLALQQFDRLSPADKKGSPGSSLTRVIQRLGALESLQTGNAELVQPADQPTSPSSPTPVRNGIIAAVLGLLLGLGLAFLSERLNRKIRDPEEARAAFNLPILGTIPRSKAISKANQLHPAGLPPPETESFRTLSASLRYFNVDRNIVSVVVTSGGDAEGKTTVAWNLARVAAASNRVIVLEADMRKPELARQHNLRSTPGLAEILTSQAELEEAIQSISPASGANSQPSGNGTLDVLTAGAVPPNPAELIESSKMDLLLATLGGYYDLVVIDTPPTEVVADAFPILRKADGVIVVMSIGQTTPATAERIRERLDRLGAHVLGLVANKAKVKRPTRNGYSYYYSGGAHHEVPSSSSSAVPG